MAKVIEILIPRCGECGKYYPNHPKLAETCCICESCGFIIKKKQGHWSNRHRDCQRSYDAKRDMERLEKAEKVEDWDGPIMDGDTYYGSLEDYVDDLYTRIEPGEPWPEWVFVPEVEELGELNASELAENLLENLGVETYDTGDINGLEELELACKTFNEANKGIKGYFEGNKKAVRVPPREPQED